MKPSNRTSIKTISEVDKGGFDEWQENRNLQQLHYTNQSNFNRSMQLRNQQPIPPIRKSKLLSAAIVNKNQNLSLTSASKLLPNNSPVIATISSPNSTQTLQVRSHLIVHPSSSDSKIKYQQSNNNSIIQTPIFTSHPSKLPISPIPFRPVYHSTINTPINEQQQQQNLFINQQHQQLQRQFQSAPQLPLRYGPAPTATHHIINHQNHHHHHSINLQNQTFHHLSDQHQSNLIRNSQMFARKTLPPSFQMNRNHPQYFSNQQQQPLPHSSTFKSIDQQSYLTAATNNTNSFVPQQFINNLNYDDEHQQPPSSIQTLRQRSLSAPDQVNSNRMLYQLNENVPYFSPILDRNANLNLSTISRRQHEENQLAATTPITFDQSSGAAYHPSFTYPNSFEAVNSSRQQQLIAANSNAPNYYQQPTFYDYKNYSREFSPTLNHPLLPHSPLGSDLHRIETINRMRLAQLAKERQRRFNSSSFAHHSPMNDYNSIDKLNKSDFINYLAYRDKQQRLLDEKRFLEKKLLKQQLKRKQLYASARLDQDDFEADVEEDELASSSGYLFHKSLTRKRLSGNKKIENLKETLTLDNLKKEEETCFKPDDHINKINKIVVVAANNSSSDSCVKAKSNLLDDNSISDANSKTKSIEEDLEEVKEAEVNQLNSINKISINNGLSGGEELGGEVSSGRGSSNLDNSPKYNKQLSSSSNTVVKSNSSSSGFASRTFSITGSPDKPSPEFEDDHQRLDSQFNQQLNQIDKIQRRRKKLTTNEVSEADENYEFDQFNSPSQSNEFESRLTNFYKKNWSQPNLQRLRNLQSLQLTSSLSACTTPVSSHPLADKEFKMQKQQRRLLLKQQQQFDSQLIATPTRSFISDENFEVDDYYDALVNGNRIDAADEEIRQLHDIHNLTTNRKRILNSLHNDRNLSNYISRHHQNSPNLHNLSNLHRRTFDQRSFNLIQSSNFATTATPTPLNRTVFSDSELYENQLSNNLSNQIQNDMSKYLRRLRCEQLKEEFRRKYSDRFKSTNLETAC